MGSIYHFDGLGTRSCFQCLVIVCLVDSRIIATMPRYMTGNLLIPRLSRASAGLAGVKMPVIPDII